jgi:cyclic pyranopterin phosphate synthase
MATRPRKKKLTHVDEQGHPAMVDVSAKAVTARVATAQCFVEFPRAAADALRAADYRNKKGPVIDTAIIAGTQSVKRTHELIPFCHALPVDGCSFEISFIDKTMLRIECTVSVTARTGVEMEAMTGASVAALTIYDMCKALSHGIVIRDLRLLEKRGGRSGVWRAGQK